MNNLDRGRLANTQRFTKSTSKEYAIDEGVYGKLIKIGSLGNLRLNYSISSGVNGIPFYIGNEGGGQGDWTELGVNEKNPQEVETNDRSYYNFELDDDLIDDLDNKTIRIVAHYTGSFNCESSIVDGVVDLFDKSAGSNSKGDMQVTNAQHEYVTSGDTTNTQVQYLWSEITTNSNVSGRSAGEMPVDTYEKQVWSTINNISDQNGGQNWITGQFNYVRSENQKSPTSGTGQLIPPQKYANLATAHVGTNSAIHGDDMWVRTDKIIFEKQVATPNDANWDRITFAIGAHGDACGTMSVYIYVEPVGNSLPTPTDTIAPTGPDLASANIENDEANLTWEGVSASDLNSYNISYRYRGVSDSLFTTYQQLGTADTFSNFANYTLNDSTYGISQRYGEFQFKIQPIDEYYNLGTGAEFPVKGQFEDISFVTSGTQIVSSGGQTLSITGIQANDLIMVSGTSDSVQVNAPTGFTELEDDDGSNNPGAVVCYKITSGTSESITLPNQGGTNAQQIIWTYQVFRNVSTSNPIDGSVSNHNSGSSRINLPSLTTTTDNCMIVIYGMVDDDGYPASSLFLPSGYTKAVADSTGLGLNSNYSTVIGGYKLEGSAGTYNPGFIQLSENDGRDGFTIALRPKQEDFKTTLPEFSYIYWEATQSTSTSFYVYCEFDITNSDIPTSAKAYVTVDGTTPSTSNFVKEAVLVDTTTGSTAGTWDSSTQLGFSTSGVAINDDVKVLIVANNSKGDENSVVVTLTIAALGNNNTEYVYP